MIVISIKTEIIAASAADFDVVAVLFLDNGKRSVTVTADIFRFVFGSVSVRQILIQSEVESDKAFSAVTAVVEFMLVVEIKRISLVGETVCFFSDFSAGYQKVEKRLSAILGT